MKRSKVSSEHRALAELLLWTFRPRMDLYAQRLDDPEEVERINAYMRLGKEHLPAVHVGPVSVGDWRLCRQKGVCQPLTVDVVARHCAGISTVGFYPMLVDGTVNSVSVDFDNHHGQRGVQADPRADYDALVAVLLRRGVRLLGNHSRGGAGFWVHLLTPAGTSAREGRAALHALLEESRVKQIRDGGTFDALCPKQDRPYQTTDGRVSPGNLFCVPCAGRWMTAPTPGTHFVGTAPSIQAQIEHLRAL